MSRIISVSEAGPTSVSRVFSHVDWGLFDALFDPTRVPPDDCVLAECKTPYKNHKLLANVTPRATLVPPAVRAAAAYLRRHTLSLRFAFAPAGNGLVPRVGDTRRLAVWRVRRGDEALQALVGAGRERADRGRFVARLSAAAAGSAAGGGAATPAANELVDDTLLAAPRDVHDGAFRLAGVFDARFYDLIARSPTTGGNDAAVGDSSASANPSDRLSPRGQTGSARAPPPAPGSSTRATPLESRAAERDVLNDPFRFVLTCEKVSFDVGPVEPLFGVAAIYDVVRKERISETFYFDFNDASLSHLFNFENETLSAADKGALFSVDKPAASVVLVVRIERLLRGDVDADLSTYSCKAKDLQAATNSFMQDTRKLAARGAANMQPLAWAATELFSEEGKWLGGRRAVLDLMAVTTNQCGDGWVMEKGLRGAAKRIAIGRVTLAMRRLAPLSPSVDEARVVPPGVNNARPHKGEGVPSMLVMGPSCERYVLERVNGFMVPERPQEYHQRQIALNGAKGDAQSVPEIRCREVLPLDLPSVAATRAHDFLFVYCESVVVKQEANVMIEVSLAVGDATLERVVCQRNTAPEHRFSQFGSTSVVYRSKQPQWYDEIKIRLPTVVTTAHTLHFTFFHIVPASKLREKSSWVGSKSNHKERVVLGTSSLPLITLVPAPQINSGKKNQKGGNSPRPSTEDSKSREPSEDVSHRSDGYDAAGEDDDGEADGDANNNANSNTDSNKEEHGEVDKPTSGDDGPKRRSTDNATLPRANSGSSDSNVSESGGAVPISAVGTNEFDAAHEHLGLYPHVRKTAVADAEASAAGGKQMRRFLPDGPHVLPVNGVRWMDSKRNTFVVRTQLVSSIRTQDDALLTFLHTLAPSTPALRTAVQALFQARTATLFHFFPLIASQFMAIVCSAERTVAINAINSLRALLDKLHGLSPSATQHAADVYAQSAFRHRSAADEAAVSAATSAAIAAGREPPPMVGSAEPIAEVTTLPRDAHAFILHRWLNFRRKRRTRRTASTGHGSERVSSREFPEHDNFFIGLILRSLALRGKRLALSAQFREELYILLSELIDDCSGPGRELNSITRFLGQLAALMRPSYWLVLLHRFVRHIARSPSGVGLPYCFQLLVSFLRAPCTSPIDCPGVALHDEKLRSEKTERRRKSRRSRVDYDDGEMEGETLGGIEFIERRAATAHSISSLLVSLVRRALCDDAAPGETRRLALLALREAIGAFESMDLSGAVTGAASGAGSAGDVDPAAVAAAAAAAAAAAKDSKESMRAIVAAEAKAKELRGELLGSFVSLLGAVTRMQAAGVFQTRRSNERCELTLACVAVLRAAPDTVLFDAWLLRVDHSTRRHFVRLLCEFVHMVHGASPAVRSEVMRVCTVTLCELMVRLDGVSGLAESQAEPPATAAVGAAKSDDAEAVVAKVVAAATGGERADGARRLLRAPRSSVRDVAAHDVLDGVLTMAMHALHMRGGRRYLAALVRYALDVPRFCAALFPTTVGEQSVPPGEVLATLLLRMCVGDVRKALPVGGARRRAGSNRSESSNDDDDDDLDESSSDDDLDEDQAGSSHHDDDDVGLSDAQLGRTLLVLALRADGQRATSAPGGGLGQFATQLARAGAFACANGVDARTLLSSLMRLAGVDAGRWGGSLAPTLDALSRAAAAHVPQLALARRRHALAESLLSLAASSLAPPKRAPASALVWLEALERSHEATAAGLIEEIAHVRLLRAALVAGHMRSAERLDPLLALLLERAFTHVSAPALRLYLSSSSGGATKDKGEAAKKPPAKADALSLWRRTGLLRLLRDAADALSRAGAGRACTQLCHALAHANMAARNLAPLARTHEIAAEATRELARRAGADLETSLHFLVRFREDGGRGKAEDYVYRQSLAGYASTTEVALRIQSRILAECRAANPDEEPLVLDILPEDLDEDDCSTDDEEDNPNDVNDNDEASLIRLSRKERIEARKLAAMDELKGHMLVVVEPLFPVFNEARRLREKLTTTDHGVVLRGSCSTVHVRWRHAFPGPLARSRVIGTRVEVTESKDETQRTFDLTEEEKAKDAKDGEAVFRCADTDASQDGGSSELLFEDSDDDLDDDIDATLAWNESDQASSSGASFPSKRAKRRSKYAVDPMQYFAQQRRMATARLAFERLRAHVRLALEQNQLNS